MKNKDFYMTGFYVGYEFPDYFGQKIEIGNDNSNPNAPCYKFRFEDGSIEGNMDDGDYSKIKTPNQIKQQIGYTYRYCTERMIEDARKEMNIEYPDVMEFIEYKEFKTNAKNIQEANKAFLDFQLSLGKIFEIDDDVMMGIDVENDEDRYINHGLKQDWDTHYFE